MGFLGLYRYTIQEMHTEAHLEMQEIERFSQPLSQADIKRLNQTRASETSSTDDFEMKREVNESYTTLRKEPIRGVTQDLDWESYEERHKKPIQTNTRL